MISIFHELKMNKRQKLYKIEESNEQQALLASRAEEGDRPGAAQRRMGAPGRFRRIIHTKDGRSAACHQRDGHAAAIQRFDCLADLGPHPLTDRLQGVAEALPEKGKITRLKCLPRALCVRMLCVSLGVVGPEDFASAQARTGLNH